MYIIKSNIFNRFLIIATAVILLMVPVNSKCLNSSTFKYDLLEVSSVSGYYSLCSQHSPRSCCSKDNLQFLGKKVSKVLEGHLSHSCRQVLQNLLCSSCDGDIGEQIREGVCLNYCGMVFQECKKDYFSMDANNNVKVCREEDIICSKLQDIVNGEEGNACAIFGLNVNPLNCWNGQISAVIRGRSQIRDIPSPKLQPKSSKLKPKHHKKSQKSHQKQPNPKKKKISPNKTKRISQPPRDLQASNQDNMFSDQMKTYFSLLGLLGSIIVGIYVRKVYRRWKRQNRYR